MSANLQKVFSGVQSHGTVQQNEVLHRSRVLSARKQMLRPGLAKKVTIHLNEDTSSKLDYLYNEIFSFLYEQGVAGATLMRPAAGFGSHHRLHQSEHGHGSDEHMPVRIEFIESPDRVEDLLPHLCELLSDGLIEAHDTVVYKSSALSQTSEGRPA